MNVDLLLIEFLYLLWCCFQFLFVFALFALFFVLLALCCFVLLVSCLLFLLLLLSLDCQFLL